jgi:hypothetical protein
MKKNNFNDEISRQLSLIRFNNKKTIFEQVTPPKFMGQDVGGTFDNQGVYNVPEVEIIGYRNQDLIDQFNSLSYKYNQLLRANRTWYSEPTKGITLGSRGGKLWYFPESMVKKPNQTRQEIRGQISNLQSAYNTLSNDITKGTSLLESAKKIKPLNGISCKPLDVTNIEGNVVMEAKWGTYLCTGYMLGLKSIDSGSSSVYMDWYRNYGQYDDINAYKLTQKEIDYINSSANRKLDQMTDLKTSVQKWTESEEFSRMVHNTLMFGSLAITLLSGGATAPLLIAAGLDVADAAYYAAEDKPYEAGLSLFFALIPGGPLLWKGAKKGVEITGDALRTTQSFTKPTALSTTKTGLDLMINTGSAVKSYVTSTAKILQFFKSLISFHIARFLELGKIDSLFGWLYWLVEKGYIITSFLTKFGLMIGGIFYTWAKIAEIIGIEKTLEKKKIQKAETSNTTFDQLLTEFNRLVWDLDTNLSINDKTKNKDLYLLQVALYTYFSPSVGKPTAWGVFDSVTEDMVKKLQKEKDVLTKEDGIIDRDVAGEISYMVRDKKINSEDLLSNYKKFNPDFLIDETEEESEVPSDAPFTEEDLKKAMTEQKDKVVKETVESVTMTAIGLDDLIPNFEEIIKDIPAE